MAEKWLAVRRSYIRQCLPDCSLFKPFFGFYSMHRNRFIFKQVDVHRNLPGILPSEHQWWIIPVRARDSSSVFIAFESFILSENRPQDIGERSFKLAHPETPQVQHYKVLGASNGTTNHLFHRNSPSFSACASMAISVSESCKIIIAKGCSI